MPRGSVATHRTIAGLAAALLAASCASVSGVPAKGTLSGEAIETTVDSDVARYFLESYIQGKNENPRLHGQIDALTHRYERSLPSREELRVISSEASSVDFASALPR